MLTIVVVTLHVVVSAMLLILVLLHSGKGGGLSDMFGGGMGAAAQGSTVVEKNLDRLTVVSAADLRLHHTSASASAQHPELTRRPDAASVVAPRRIVRAATSEWRNWQTRQLEGLVPEGRGGSSPPSDTRQVTGRGDLVKGLGACVVLGGARDPPGGHKLVTRALRSRAEARYSMACLGRQDVPRVNRSRCVPLRGVRLRPRRQHA